jgi:hypothetical protein
MTALTISEAGSVQFPMAGNAARRPPNLVGVKRYGTSSATSSGVPSGRFVL